MEFTKGQEVYISSDDRRQEGFDATITSIGSKYITVTDKYGRKHKFDKERYYCIDWTIYHLEESRASYQKRKLRCHKLLTIKRSEHMLDTILSDSEIDDIYDRIVSVLRQKE